MLQQHSVDLSEYRNTLVIQICTPYQILFRCSNQEKWDGRSMWHVWGTGYVHTGFWWRDLK